MSNYTKIDGAVDFTLICIIIVLTALSIRYRNDIITSKIDKLESKIDSINVNIGEE